MNVLVEFEPVGRRLEAAVGQTVLAAAQGILDTESGGVIAPCGGKGLCGRCKIRLEEGELSPPNENEIKLLGKDDIDRGYRLACQAILLGPAKIEIPRETLTGRQNLQVDGMAITVTPDPAVKRYTVPLKTTSVAYPYSTLQQVQLFLKNICPGTGLGIDSGLLSKVDAMAEEGSLNITIRGAEVINAFKAPGGSGPLGYAVDLGTTKIAGFLVDLETGSTLEADGILNPQIIYGEDVISRLVYALEGEEQYDRITRVLREGLDSLLQTLCQKAGVSPEYVEEAVIAGNTAMHHLLLKLPVRQLATAPYVPAATLPLEIKSRELGLSMATGSVSLLMPGIAGFVGGDHVAMILSSRIHEAPGVTLGLDIGTNTEIVLAVNGELLCCSCASGPAFEGAHIQQGMRAVEGAVSKVKLIDRGRRVHYETIGHKPPMGICGSGILDATAELYREGIVSYNGRLDKGHPRVRLNPGRKVSEFILVPSGEDGAGQDIVITQKDISEIQLAKAAMAAGTKILLKEAGLKEENIERVIVAGSFGTHLLLDSAKAIGMLPAIPDERFQQVGNAAGSGARMALISLSARKKAEEIAGKIKYIELAAMPEFGDTYINEMSFPHI
ncbi:methyltransferase corrinoid activation protein [Desulfocucumis palustris]|uniref:Methyltransferase corrinoid activation protein n=1 Tax=Desulfocucumis palustris TaxID=1898651 RepID=A0A2L2XEV8_9FIRM|nr:ASKHA domain-containing protein [Desulfocucumis palustris]GBF32361.1 methyltransferase corrinoid activation protein [Desulfocucumis palustris]